VSSLQIPAFLKNIADLVLLPKPVLRDFVQLASFEKNRPSNSLETQWLIIMPEDGPKGFCEVGSPCTLIEFEMKRISVLIKFSDSTGYRLIPLRINYASGIVAPWRLGSASVEDLTAIPADSPYLSQQLESLAQKDMIRMLTVDKLCIVASGKQITAKQGGPGKLYPMVRHLSTKNLFDLKL
jgi:hypothetical protein